MERSFEKNEAEDRQKKGVLNRQRADSGAKIIFEDNTLCCQFLNDYVPLPHFKAIKRRI